MSSTDMSVESRSRDEGFDAEECGAMNWLFHEIWLVNKWPVSTESWTLLGSFTVSGNHTGLILMETTIYQANLLDWRGRKHRQFWPIKATLQSIHATKRPSKSPEIQRGCLHF
nr:hypothetical transcript [Hymenolepis microstoma]